MSLLLLFRSGASPNALTGVSATGAVGTLRPSRTIALSGVATICAVGTLTASGGDTVGLVIDGVERDIRQGWEIHTQANGRAVMRFQVVSTDGSYRPDLDDEVVFGVAGDRLFGGYVENISESGVGDVGRTPIVSTVIARDYNTLPNRRYVSEIVPAGTLKAALEVLVDYIPGGVTLSSAQVDGPSLEELNFEDMKGDEALNYLAAMTGYIWTIDEHKQLLMYAPGTLTAPFNITVPNCKAIGDVVVEPTRSDYANRVIVRNDTIRSQADDAGEQSSHGLWEMLVSAPDGTSQSAADDLADAILLRSTPVLKKVRYRTRESGVLPGQTQTITLPTRNVNNTFLVTDVVMRSLGNTNDVISDVTAIEGLVYQSGWRETYKRWNGSDVPLAGAIYGSAATRRFAYFLGGSGVEAVRSSGPDWVPVSGGSTVGTGSVQVQLNTVARGTVSATVVVRMRAVDAGVSVKARLYDVTDSVACAGESALVTSQTWQSVTFTATLTAGSHFYELQILPGAANADCLAVGYLE